MAISLCTISDIQEFEPDILDYGIPTLTAEITRANADVVRDIRIKWWPTQQIGVYDINYLGANSVEMNEDLLTVSQWTICAVYQALGFHILPKLAKFEVDGDIFERKMDYYRKEYEREFDLILRDGVEYDLDSSGTVENREKEAQHYLRLKR
jgi:hypothetical protein